MNRIAQKEFHFKLLQEEAVDTDSLDDGIHEKVANQLLYIIENNQSGLAIGLEGPWGAGKSTVVNIFKRKLDERTLFFNFDAWAHEGDPLRRVFLENLIQSADTNQENTDLKNLRNEISGQTKTIKIESKSRSSKLGVLLGLSAILVPLGAAILSGIDYNTIVMPWSKLKGDIAASLWLAAFLTLAPAWVAIYWMFKGDKDSEGFLNRDWSFIQGNSSENYTQNVTEDTERSSVEFEFFFQKIFQITIGENKTYNRAVIVIDNLDRVSPETAKQIWSTLQTFLQHKNSFSAIDTSKLWFLIPHDKKGISKIWATGNTENDLENYKSFIEKSIQIVVDVPLPIHSSWTNYLEKISQEALHGWTNEDKDAAISVFKRFESLSSSVPTPRYMRRFVNQIAVIAFRWGNYVSIEAIALYALFKIDFSITEIKDQLINGSLPKEYKCISCDQIIMQELAGMLFGVTPEKGIELLLGGELEKAIKSGDRNKVTQLAKTHKKAIIPACHLTISKSIPTTSHISEYCINFSKSVTELFSQFKTQLAPEINSFKEFWLNENTKWELEHFDYTSVLADLHEIDSNWNGFKSIRDKIIKTEIDKSLKTIGTTEFNKNKLANINKLYAKLKKITGPASEIRYQTLNKANIHHWVSIPKEHRTELDFILPEKNTIKELCQSINHSNPSEETCSTLILLLPEYATDEGWDVAVEKLTQWLSYRNRQINNGKAYQLLCSIAINLKAKHFETITQALSTPQFVRRTQQTPIQNMPELCALVAIIFGGKIQDSPAPTNIKQFWSNHRNAGMVNSVHEFLKQLENLSIIPELAEDKRNVAAIHFLRSSEEFKDRANKSVESIN